MTFSSKKSSVSFTPSSGFSFIELLIVMAVMGIFVIGGIAAYGRFNARQLVITAGKEMLVDLRQAQSKSLSNVKSVNGCQNSPLTGYQIDGTGSRYTVTEVYSTACATGGASYVVKTVNLPAGVQFQSAFRLTFTGLSGGVTLVGAAPSTTISFCNKNCQSGGLRYSITVTRQGLIQDVPVADIP